MCGRTSEVEDSIASIGHWSYSLSKLSWHDRKRGKCGMHLVLNRKQFSHVNPSQLSAQTSTLHMKKGW